MTCIVGIKEGNDVWIGADSFCGNGDSKGLVTTPKVFRLFEPGANRPILMATCGGVRVHQLLRYALQVPAFDPGRDMIDYLVRDFCPALVSCLDKGGILKKEDGEDHYDGSALLAIEGRLITLTNGFTFEESHRGFCGHAAGGDYACGSLFQTKGLPAEERLRLALEAASELSSYVTAPFHIEKL